MNTSLASLEAFLRVEAARRTKNSAPSEPVVTISREEGAGGEAIARLTGTLLNARNGGKGQPWLVLDDALAEQIVHDHHLPKQIRAYLSDEQNSYIDDIVEEVVGLHPSRFVLVQNMIETILRLAKIGRAVFVGRAAHVVLMGMPEARHVRIVGALDERAKRVSALSGLSLKDARRRAKKIDSARMRFIGHYFKRDINDPHGYDMTLNTDRLSLEEAARMVEELIPGSSSSAKASRPALLKDAPNASGRKSPRLGKRPILLAPRAALRKS